MREQREATPVYRSGLSLCYSHFLANGPSRIAVSRRDVKIHIRPWELLFAGLLLLLAVVITHLYLELHSVEHTGTGMPYASVIAKGECGSG
jgi:hypothetical protein